MNINDFLECNSRLLKISMSNCDYFERWSRSKRSSRGKVTCIYYRAEWVDDNKKGHNSNKVEPSGYVNLASYSKNHGTEKCNLKTFYPNNYEWLGLVAT